MKTLSRFRSWLRSLVHRARLEREMDDELRFHLEHRTDELTRNGRVQPKYTRSATILFADIQGSTLLEEIGQRDFVRFERVPMRRFDKLFTSFARPALCKIDVQGAELMVLQGMANRLREIDALVVETSTIATVKGGAEVGGVVRFLGEHGFVVADIIGLKRRPLDGATAQVDLLFLPEASPVRADRRWSGA